MIALLSAEGASEDEMLRRFSEDGVVALRGALSSAEIERLMGGLSQQLAGMVGASPFDETDDTTLHIGLNTWRTIAPVRAVACGATLASLAACLLNETQIRFLSDRTLVRSPSSGHDADFAPDLLDGAFHDDACVTLTLPLYEMTQARGQISFLTGSHQVGKPVRVASLEASAGTVIAHHPRTKSRLGEAGGLIALLQLRYAAASARLTETGAPPDDLKCPRVWPLH